MDLKHLDVASFSVRYSFASDNGVLVPTSAEVHVLLVASPHRQAPREVEIENMSTPESTDPPVLEASPVEDDGTLFTVRVPGPRKVGRTMANGAVDGGNAILDASPRKVLGAPFRFISRKLDERRDRRAKDEARNLVRQLARLSEEHGGPEALIAAMADLGREEGDDDETARQRDQGSD